MNMKVITLALALLSAKAAKGYDIGCLYPERMPDPFTARGQLGFAGVNFFAVFRAETPIVVHQAHQSTYCQTNCVAYHDDKSLNVLTKVRPPFSTPPEYFNSWSRMLCIAQCYGMIYPPEMLAVLFASWGFEPLPTSPALIGCNESPSCIIDVVREGDYDPRLIGQFVALEIEAYVRVDGFNSLGELSYDPDTGSAVECTANCARYADITGYFPRNNPTMKKKKKSKKDKKGKNGDTNKYWQPLLEEVHEFGTLIRQEHVTPHIGIVAKPALLTTFMEAKDPKYDYKYEAELLLERLSNLSGDITRQDMIKFFDNKLLVRLYIQVNLLTFYGQYLSFEDYLVFLSGISSAEYDATIQCWREKRNHDLVRPTTVIQDWNDVVIETFNDEESTPKEIKARDFQPYIRAMPHSEFPSGSASLCTAYAAFSNLFTNEYFDSDLPLLPIGNTTAAVNLCEGRFDFGLGCESIISFESLQEMATLCGESRLWAGLHFSASVPAGEKIVSGLGELAMDFVKTIKAGSDWTNTVTVVNAEASRPECANFQI